MGHPVSCVQGDMLADIGGYLGMFLGWSCLSVLMRLYHKFRTFKCVVKDLFCNEYKRKEINF